MVSGISYPNLESTNHICIGISLFPVTDTSSSPNPPHSSRVTLTVQKYIGKVSPPLQLQLRCACGLKTGGPSPLFCCECLEPVVTLCVSWIRSDGIFLTMLTGGKSWSSVIGVALGLGILRVGGEYLGMCFIYFAEAVYSQPWTCPFSRHVGIT